MESATMEVSVVVDEFVWFVDDTYGGLYTRNMENNAIKNVLPMEILLKNPWSIPGQLIDWRNWIIIIPRLTNRYFVFFHKITKDVKYHIFFKEEQMICGAVVFGDLLYLFPQNTGTAFYTISLDGMICVEECNSWYKVDKKKFEIWDFCSFANDIYLPIRKTRDIVKYMLGKKLQPVIIQLDISEDVGMVSVSEKNIWILPIQGNFIYRTDMDGRNAECIRIGHKNHQADEFIRILNVEGYVFLLPVSDAPLSIYDSVKAEWTFVDLAHQRAPISSNRVYNIGIPYWSYFCRDGYIYFTPYSAMQCLRIKLDTLECEFTDWYLPASENERNLRDRSFYMLTKRYDTIFFTESNESRLEDFLGYIRLTAGI